MKTINPQYYQSAIKNTKKTVNIQTTYYQVRRTKCLLCIHITQAHYNLKLNSLLEHYNGDLMTLQRALYKLLKSPTTGHSLKGNVLRLLIRIQQVGSASL